MGAVSFILPPARCPTGCRVRYVRRGLFRRGRDGKAIQRYLCRGCGRSFSDATDDLCYRQKKRDLNPLVFKLLTGGYSQRRTARDLRVNRKTVVRKFLFLGGRALEVLKLTNSEETPTTAWEFDDLETFEHTKCKPLSVIQAVDTKTRRILGFRVATMPAKGLLAERARKKYGRRIDERAKLRKELFEEIADFVHPNAVIRSDESPHYPADVAKHFPHAVHERFRGRRGCATGQGELKRGGYDPLFTLNHTFAMLRANINRLFRRTWCTTKRQHCLTLHIALYAVRHNLDLIRKTRPVTQAA